MNVARAIGLTDAGRRRRQNEDAFVCEPPVFAVADGMGGAQAGELASRLAAAALGGSPRGDLSGRDRVLALIDDANRSVFERAAGDESVSGMGTTMTVALVEDDAVWIGHVGDSRAYLLREGTLEQLTEDHSLVAELVRSGRLTPEEAEGHPHRSVITRALGTEEEVEVDVFAVVPEAGDLFMLCSDGLTTMVDDESVLAIVGRNRDDLAAAARALVDEANRAGGEDNITVVLAEIGPADDLAAPLDGEGGAAGDEDDEDTLHGIESPFAHAAPVRRGKARGRSARIVLAGGLLTVVVAGALAVIGLSRAHFVGVQDDGHVAVYQGLPWDLGFGLKLYRVAYESPLLAANLSQEERRRLFDHNLVSRDTAVTELERYERYTVP